ncbi:MAG: hypothetical protein GX660_27895 [Clostridiaceae bacterium]|nr:hypothetical protein [Clostridiaceae bacterium]
MKKYLLFVYCLTGLLGCDKEENNSSRLQDGTYVGTFLRELVWSPNDTAKITMTFSSGNWSGSSNKIKYPALCNGTYSIIGDTIIFENLCAWTAEFDWTLILSGKYKLTIEGNTIEFERDCRSATSDTYVDKYKLKRQE